MTCWLLKSDPDDYAFADLVRDQATRWDGVANAAALGHLRRMKKGDLVFVYETGAVKAIVGRATVAADAEPGGDDPKAATVRLRAGKPLARPLTLAAIKADPAFAAWELVRISRLSVMPVPDSIRLRIEALSA